MNNTPIIAVSFILYGDEFDLNEISYKMGLTATEMRDKNIFYPQESIDSGIAKSEWIFEIREENCNNISIPFNKLLNILNNKKEIINSLSEQFNLTTAFIIIIKMQPNILVPLIEISKNAISFSNLISAEINFDIYCYDSYGKYLSA